MVSQDEEDGDVCGDDSDAEDEDDAAFGGLLAILAPPRILDSWR